MNTTQQLAAWREQWANLANRHLERHGHEARIDHRSLKAQGIDREPGVHLGYAAHGMAKRGAQSDRMDELRAILARNEIRTDLKELRSELAGLQREEAQLAAARAAEQKWQQEQAAHARANRGDDQTRGAQPGRCSALTARPIEAAGRVAAGGLYVANAATGAMSKLGDFMLGLLAGPVPSPAAGQEPRKKPLVTRLDRERADQALERMGADMEAGRNLRAEDIHRLTDEQKHTLQQRGDEGVRDLVDDARRRAERAREEERGRGMER